MLLSQSSESREQIEEFLAEISFHNYKINEIPNDCSKRRYYNISQINQREDTFILMDASNEKNSVAPFVKVNKQLADYGFSVPKLYNINSENGFILMEDFGDKIFTKALLQYPELEEELYRLAVDVLLSLHKKTVPDDYLVQDKELLNVELEVFFEYFLKNQLLPSIFNNAKAELLQIFSELYKHIDQCKKVLVLRDYMADNLIYLPKREGIAKVGILDFQDALTGFSAYDLVSLLEDARRDVSASVVEMAISRYTESMAKQESSEFLDSYAILGMQRNLRIVGVFNRMNILYGKPKYLGYLPRLWEYIKHGAERPILKQIKEWFKKYGIEL